MNFANAFTPERLQEAWNCLLNEFPFAIWETLYSTLLATLFTATTSTSTASTTTATRLIVVLVLGLGALTLGLRGGHSRLFDGWNYNR